MADSESSLHPIISPQAEEAQTLEAPVIFKSSRKSRNLRTKKTVDEPEQEPESGKNDPIPSDAVSPSSPIESEGAENAEPEQKMTMEELRMVQKLRERKKGLAIAGKGEIVKSVIAGSSAESEAAESALRTISGLPAHVKIGLNNMKKSDAEKAEEALISLDNNFTKDSYVSELDKQMLAYIEEGLQSRGLNKGGSGKAGGGSNGKQQKLPEDELYTVPEQLALPQKRELEDDSNRWLTGIIEVQLSTDYKFANIEATEIAKMEMAQKVAREKEEAALRAPALHRRYQIVQMKRDRNDEGPPPPMVSSGSSSSSAAGARGGAMNRNVPMEMRSSDDLVLDKFKKRFKYK